MEEGKGGAREPRLPRHGHGSDKEKFYYDDRLAGIMMEDTAKGPGSGQGATGGQQPYWLRI
jgi:hypothetical protein